MKRELKICVTGTEEIERKTTVEISEKDGILTFVFTAKNCKYYCPYQEYNKIHAVGDVCEIFIGSHENREQYYEMELTPYNAFMLAKVTYLGEGEDGPMLHLDFVEKSFVETKVDLTKDGYVATLSFPKSAVATGEGELYFNAYRIDTDGGKLLEDKQLAFALNPTMRPKFHTPSKFVLLKDFL